MLRLFDRIRNDLMSPSLFGISADGAAAPEPRFPQLIEDVSDSVHKCKAKNTKKKNKKKGKKAKKHHK